VAFHDAARARGRPERVAVDASRAGLKSSTLARYVIELQLAVSDRRSLANNKSHSLSLFL
jgi:hypothetical protein